MIKLFFKRTLALFLAAALTGSGPIPALWAAERAVMEGLEVGTDDITAHLSRKTEFKAFTLAEPPRIVVDLLDTEHTAPSQYQDADGKILERVRSGQYQREPDLVTRIVLYLKELAAYQASWDETRLKISLFGLPPAEPRDAPAPTPAPAPAAPEAPAHATLEDLAVAGNAVTARLSRKVKFEAFTLSEPSRLIVDFTGTLRGSTPRNIKGEGDLIERVRSSQFKIDPPVTRVVLYLNGPAAYQASWSGTDLQLSLFAAPAAASAAPEVAPEPKPAPPAAPKPEPAPEPETAVLDSLTLGPTALRAGLSRQVKFNSFALAEPPRLVLEFSDTRRGKVPRELKGSGAIQRVRSAQYKRTPPITRVVLYLDQAAAYQAKWEGTELVIGLLLPEKPKPEPAPVAVLEPQIEAPPEPAPVQAPVKAQVQAPAPAKLVGLTAGSDEISAGFSKKVQYETFVLNNPPRLVFEFMDTDKGNAPRKLDGKGKLLKRVRTSQYKTEPLVTRVVLNLEYPAGYRTRWVGNNLNVELFGLTAAAEIKPEAETPPLPEEVVEIPKPPAPAAKPPAPKPVVKPPAPKPVVVLAKKPEPAPMKDAAVAPERESEPARLPVKMTTEASAELEEMAMKSDASPVRDDFSPGKSRVKKPGPDTTLKALARRDIMATLPSDPTTLEFDAMDVRDILTLLATKANINIVWGADVQGPLTLHLTDVPFNEAFTTILSMAGLVTNQVGENILRVMTPATLATERKVAVNQTRVLQLRYVKAAEVKPSIDAVRGAEGREGNIVIDAKSNSLILTDTLDGIASVERLLAQLDRRPQQVLIEAKLVEVQLSKNINFGIQWDYLSQQEGKINGEQGTNYIGAAPVPTPVIVSPAFDPVTSKPFDQNTTLDLDGAPLGGTGRGTGVNLPASSIFGAFTLGRVTNNYFLSATLTAAASEGKAKVLSDPKITTLNGEKANIQITTSIPYVQTETSQGAATTTSEKVVFQETGITLDVTPTINADGRIHLEVTPNVTQPSQQTASAGSTGAIATDTRTAKTKVLVRDGGTIVIGGLITDTVTDQVAKVPFFGDIPLIGWLFKKKFKDRRRVELLIFVTSKIVPS